MSLPTPQPTARPTAQPTAQPAPAPTPSATPTAPAQATADPAQQAAPGGAPGQPVRAENLLPAQDEPDGRFDIAEEVSLDQQSDQARRVGALPPAPAPGVDVGQALADSLSPANTPAPNTPPRPGLDDKLPPPA